MTVYMYIKKGKELNSRIVVEAGVYMHNWVTLAMPHDFLSYTQQPNSLYFLIALFGLSKNQFEFFKSVQWFKSDHAFLCLKVGPKVGKVLNRDKEGNVANQMTP